MYDYDYNISTQKIRSSNDYPTDSYRQFNVKDLSTKELEDIVRGQLPSKDSPRFSSHRSISPLSRLNKSPPRDASSKSLAGAMRALQDKIHLLETENSDLKERLIAAESKGQKDREQWQARCMEELKQASTKDKSMQSRILELEEELRKHLQRVLILEEQLKIKETQIRHCENEIKRNIDQYVIDKENTSLQLEHLQKQLVAKSKEEKNLKLAAEKSEREKNLANEELAQEKRISSGLKAEVQYLRENASSQRSSLQKNFEIIEAELTKQNQDFSQKIRELEIKLRSLKELNNNQSQQIDFLKKENQQLQTANKVSEDSRVEVLRNKTNDDSMLSQKKVPRKPSRSGKLSVTIKSKSPTPHSSTKSLLSEPNRTARHPYGTQKKSLGERSLSQLMPNKAERDEDCQTDIEKVEQEISSLNIKYKRLLQHSQEATGDLGGLRRELSSLAADMEKKNEELYELKRRQQSILKQRLF
ncbi:unnamed protein product [Blepharisma stoltei]|uniref:Uncharacterized protein n=1 Tax=Blepharisma stoltei TaxID=1481888 RepID=A0AAU9K470_9CILI|nr:unnamed protein product [Blepharisma stoltei]